MPIINRIDMLTTGIRSEVGVKIFGADLNELEDWRGRSLTSTAAGPRATAFGVGSILQVIEEPGRCVEREIRLGQASGTQIDVV